MRDLQVSPPARRIGSLNKPVSQRIMSHRTEINMRPGDRLKTSRPIRSQKPELFYQERELSSALSRISGESSYWLISELPETNICFPRKLSRSRSKPISERVLFSSNRADIGLPQNCAGSVGILYVWRE